MAVDENEVKQFEDKYKNKLFGLIKEASSNVYTLIKQIENLGQYIGINTDLPNIVITMNNKLVELQHEFERAGISMYSTNIENYVTSSIVGDSIIFQMIEYVTSVTGDLTKYDQIISCVARRKLEEEKALKKMTRVDKFLAKIKNFFAPKKRDTSLCTEQEKEMLEFYLSNYKVADSEIWNYNLRDNIVDSITKKIREQGYSDNLIPGVLEEGVIPDLEKLGLSDLIPQLKETLIKEDKKGEQVPNVMKQNKETLEKVQKDVEDNSSIDDDYSL